MLYLPENLKKYRLMKNLTQEDVASFLHITAQSVSKWERGESYPDITFLPALANIFETSIDLLMGMDAIRAQEARYSIHSTATTALRNGDYPAAEKIYRHALLLYPNDPSMMLGLAGALALQGNTAGAILLTEKGLPLSQNEKQKATMRAVLCFLYLKAGSTEHANQLAASLPHTRESREVIQPLVRQGLQDHEITAHIKALLLGE